MYCSYEFVIQFLFISSIIHTSDTYANGLGVKKNYCTSKDFIVYASTGSGLIGMAFDIISIEKLLDTLIDTLLKLIHMLANNSYISWQYEQKTTNIICIIIVCYHYLN